MLDLKGSIDREEAHFAFYVLHVNDTKLGHSEVT